MIKLEVLCDLKDQFKMVTNCKLQIPTLIIELVNLGSHLKPQNINLGLRLTSDERYAFIHLLRIYKDLFSCNYDNLKTYDQSIIQHTIPMLPYEKPIQKNLRKIHPNLENQIKNELKIFLKLN